MNNTGMKHKIETSGEEGKGIQPLKRLTIL
jgi:hypothetical protein